MSYLERLRGVLVANARHRFYSLIPNDHVYPPQMEGHFEPKKCYLRVWLNEMYLAHKRVWYRTRSPVVHTTCRFNYGTANQELRLLVGPGDNSHLGAALDHMINLNYPLLGPVPYIGGDIELLIILVAMEVSDYGDQFLDLLGMLSQMTGRGELKATLPLLKPLKAGIEGLFGVGMQGAQVHLGMHDTFAHGTGAPNRLVPGYRVVIDMTGDGVDPTTLWVRDGRLLQGDDLVGATPFEGADYFLFYLEKLDHRSNSPTAVVEAWDTAVQRARQANEKEVDLAVNAFKTIVLESPDLIWSDKVIQIKELLGWVKATRTLMERRGFVPAGVDTSLKAAVAEALADPERVTASGQMSRDEVVALSWR